VELMMEKQKLLKKCNDLRVEVRDLKTENMSLTQENVQNAKEMAKTQRVVSKEKLKNLGPIREQCQLLSRDIKRYKQALNDDIFVPFTIFLGQEMTHFVDAAKQLIAAKSQSEMAYNREVALRRRYFNQIQVLKGNIRVFCRIRPLLPDEMEAQHTMRVRSLDQYQVHIEKLAENDRDTDRQKTFKFDNVFSIRATQDEVFEETKELITSVLDGYNVCLFAYGQTGSGKTYTMEGINRRAVGRLFQEIGERKGQYTYKMTLNMIEIYNEKIKDLLVSHSRRNMAERDLGLKNKPTYLRMRSDANRVHIQNLSHFTCECSEDVFEALEMGYKNRAVGVTDLNAHSSRSHCILTINVEGVHHTTSTKYVSKLHLIDLAGSERVKQSNASGDRMKEAQAINKSLSALGNVLEAIKAKKQHVPYRDSKLTFLLKDSIGKHAKTLMFVNVSSCSKDVSQTMISLLFADRVRNVELGLSKQNKFNASPEKTSRRRRSMPSMQSM